MISPLEFFSHLKWIDDRPLLNVIEPYRQRIFTKALHTFGEDGRPRYNLVLCGRGKKNFKTADLILAALYKFLVWDSTAGNDCYLLANDEGQAADDLQLAKKLIAVNPLLSRELVLKQKGVDPVLTRKINKLHAARTAFPDTLGERRCFCRNRVSRCCIRPSNPMNSGRDIGQYQTYTQAERN